MVCALASGSKGNAIYVSDGKTSVLVDAGLSGRELERRMRSKGLDPEKLSAVLVTHEHSDHIRGAGVLSRRFRIPVYISAKTKRAADTQLGKLHESIHFEIGNGFSIGGLNVRPFSTSHDARDPAGFTVEHGGRKIGIATDLGIATSM
ncbi:MAG: MBL fold metallo-hydrolase, partial [bacterium]|nr:MBL fold metallo-hydrolase [bacterium]